MKNYMIKTYKYAMSYYDLPNHSHVVVLNIVFTNIQGHVMTS